MIDTINIERDSNKENGRREWHINIFLLVTFVVITWKLNWKILNSPKYWNWYRQGIKCSLYH